MTLHRVIWLPVVAALCLGAGRAPAALGSLGAELSAKKVVISAQGVESLAPVEGFAAGDVVEYRATYTNNGAETLRNALGTLPIADWAEYLAGSAVPAKITVSVDGTSFSPPPLRRASPKAGDRSTPAEVPPREYRFLRWTLGDLTAGATATVVFRVRVVRSPGGR